MDRNLSHQIDISTSCRHKGCNCSAGFELITQLRKAIAATGDGITEDFEISGVARVPGCDRQYTVANHGTRRATYLFGDITPESDMDDLLAFARQYATPESGWTLSVDRPGKNGQMTLARIPAALIVLEDAKMRIQ